LDIYPSNACTEALGPSGRKLLPERDDLKMDRARRLWIMRQVWPSSCAPETPPCGVYLVGHSRSELSPSWLNRDASIGGAG
jgi:hypothetical protein